MGRSVSSYLDTHVAVWLASSKLTSISRVAMAHIANSALLISPMVLLELQYLFEIGRIILPAGDVRRKLEYELSVQVCNFDFPNIVAAAVNENWTCEPFDRIIVAHARANGLSPLITADENVRRNYVRTVW